MQLTKEVSPAEATTADVIFAVVSLTRLLATDDEVDKGVKTAERALNVCNANLLNVIETLVDTNLKYYSFDNEIRRREHVICF